MARPDQDPRLTSIGIGEATCEKCMMELYSGADDSICEDCNLNALKKGDPSQFITDAMKREDSLSLEELAERNKAMNR
ncbi:hypothetical protein HQ571_06510 [Candidatus Kuenenbacteria bacterium]|nr:hypothetical protein [Candidatus Kuenenbacteria bacterium]